MISEDTRLEAFSLVVEHLRARIDKLSGDLATVRGQRDRYRDCCREHRKRAELAKIRRSQRGS